MTKRFEQQGKTVSVTMIREGFVEQNVIPEELPLLPSAYRAGDGVQPITVEDESG